MLLLCASQVPRTATSQAKDTTPIVDERIAIELCGKSSTKVIPNGVHVSQACLGSFRQAGASSILIYQRGTPQLLYLEILKKTLLMQSGNTQNGSRHWRLQMQEVDANFAPIFPSKPSYLSLDEHWVAGERLLSLSGTALNRTYFDIYFYNKI